VVAVVTAGRKSSASGTLSVTDALHMMSIRTMIAAKETSHPLIQKVPAPRTLSRSHTHTPCSWHCPLLVLSRLSHYCTAPLAAICTLTNRPQAHHCNSAVKQIERCHSTVLHVLNSHPPACTPSSPRR
jgi:hypothetical protein